MPKQYRDNIFGDMDSMRDARKEARRAWYADALRDGRIIEVVKHSEHHRVIEANGRQYDFWPSTGRWRRRGQTGPSNTGGINRVLQNAFKEQP